MPTTDRTVRVFISSTFRDMQAERDHLVKFVFPEIRRLCEARGVTWGEVDLRWGVTDEEAAEGKVLPICLEEIKRCRPYFLGLLGERYGWIPETLAAELLEREPWLREHLHGRKSVTELEILQGVLNDPEMAERTFFYFRDPTYAESVAAEQKRDFTAEDVPGTTKLRVLKDRIRQSHRDGELKYPPREKYSNASTLGELVLKDLTSVIDELYPADEKLDPLDREAADHAAYARSRERVYISRKEYLQRLDAHVAGAGDQPLAVLGESGSGKSALLANWTARYQQQHPDTLLVQHYIGASPHSADWAAMLRRMMGELKRRLGLQQEIPRSAAALRNAFSNWLSMAAAKGRLVLVLDALDKLEDRDGAPDLVWLPAAMPENVRVIVSTLPGRPLENIQKRGWPTLEVQPLTADERRELIRQYLGQHGKSLSKIRVESISAAPQSANPLYLRVLLDELRVFGVHERLEERIAHYLRALSPDELYRKVITRWEEDYGGTSKLVGETLTLLWGARRGLSETELLEALGQGGQPLPRARWAPLFLTMSDALVSRGGLLTFAHDFLRAATREAFLPAESQQREIHLRLADYFQRQFTGPRRTDELPWQMAAAAAWERLNALLATRDFFIKAWMQNQYDLKDYWTQIEARSSFRMLEAYRAQIEDPKSESHKEYLWVLGTLLSAMGHPAEALALQSALVEHYRATSDSHMLQVCLGSQGVILDSCGDLDGAMDCYNEQEQICRKLGILDGLAASLGNRGVILQIRGDLDRAMALHQEAASIWRKLDNLDSVQISLGNQGLILKARGDFDGAMALHTEEERICRQLGNLDGVARSFGNQGLILEARGDLDGAMTLHKEAERICRRLGDPDCLQRSFLNQANILRARGDLDTALKLYRETEQICRRLGNRDGLQRSLGNQGSILCLRGDLDGAMTLYKEQEQLCHQLVNLVSLQGNLVNQGAILQTRGDLDGAMALYKAAEPICRQLGDFDGLGVCLGNQAAILSDRGDLDGAMVLYKEMERFCGELGLIEGLAYSLFNQALALGKVGRFGEGLPLAEAAHRHATTHGYVALAKQTELLLNALRRATNT